MIKGKTKSGFEYAIEEKTLDNMELIDAIAESIENPVGMSKVISLLLGKEGKKKLYDFFRNENGCVPIEPVNLAVAEIFDQVKDIKNS